MTHRSLLQDTLTLPASITKAASLQTYYTIRLLADPERADDALRAYAYFRWVDDTLDAPNRSGNERKEFIARQKQLLVKCYCSEFPQDANPYEEMLVGLVQRDPAPKSGLRIYLNNMMAVMAFDSDRRGRTISQLELQDYTHSLASAVTECVHHFIGHRCASPRDETRYLAVTAAHITHMLRDTIDDMQAGYYNIPNEILAAGGIAPDDIESETYRAWVKTRVELARSYFQAGRRYLLQVQNPRCRLACLAYISRFEGVLGSIENEGYVLRASYPERKGLGGILRACLSVYSGFFDRHTNHLEAARASRSEQQTLRGL